MSALVKIKYVGQGEFNIHPDLTLNQVYTVLGFDGSVTAQLQAIIVNGSTLKLVIGLGSADIWELVSVTVPGDVTLFPGA